MRDATSVVWCVNRVPESEEGVSAAGYEWRDLENTEKEFYRACVRELFCDRRARAIGSKLPERTPIGSERE
jgi:hypothetical protein